MPGWFSSRVFLSSIIHAKRTLQRIDLHKTVTVSGRALVYSEKNVLFLLFLQATSYFLKPYRG
jgi:hypothetical protein